MHAKCMQPMRDRLRQVFQLLFSYGGADGSAMIPMLEEADGCRPVLIQPWSWRYARTATLYFALAWTRAEH